MDNLQVCNNLCRSVHEMVGKYPEDDSSSFALADAAVLVIAPVRDAKIVDAVLNRPNEEMATDAEPRKIQTTKRTWECLCLFLQQN